MINEEIQNMNRSLSNLCVLPFIHRHIDTYYQLRACCISSKVENEDTLEHLKTKMLNDEKPNACSACYSKEERGFSSYRNEVNLQFPDELKKIQKIGRAHV